MSAQMNRQDAPEISMATFAELDKHNSRVHISLDKGSQVHKTPGRRRLKAEFDSGGGPGNSTAQITVLSRTEESMDTPSSVKA